MEGNDLVLSSCCCAGVGELECRYSETILARKEVQILRSRVYTQNIYFFGFLKWTHEYSIYHKAFAPAK